MIEAEGDKYKTEKIATGDKLVLESQAEGKGKINKALAGRGGSVYVGLEYAKALEGLGAGELLVNSIDLDGTMKGYDTRLMKQIADSVSIPVIACGGAGNLDHIKELIDSIGVTAAAGSLFVFKGKHRAVLINYPSRQTVKELLK